MELQEQLNLVQEQIKTLQQEERKLVKQIVENESDFETKFKLWLENNDAKIVSDLFQLEMSSKFIYDNFKDDFEDKYKTYDFTEWYEDDLYYMIDHFKEDGVDVDFYTEEQKANIIKLAKEMMRANIKGVVCDW